MRKLSMLLTFFGCMMFAVNTPAQDSNFHIYLMFGQSNMEGMGAIESQDLVTNSRVLVLQDQTCSNLNRTYGEWYTAEPPLNRCWSGLGPGDYFGKTMADGTASNIRIGLVPASVAGSDIALFQKGAPIGRAGADIPSQFSGGYAWLMDLARKAQKSGDIKGIIFHQGETNTGDPDWKYKVQKIVNDLRNDLGIGNVPFLAGELLYAKYGSCCSSHNVEINQLPNIISNAHVISANGLPGADEAHFTSASYRELGRRYAQKMLTLVDSGSSSSSGSSDGCGTCGSYPYCCNDTGGEDWGWENQQSCVAQGSGAAQDLCGGGSSGSSNSSSDGSCNGYPYCSGSGDDPDGDGWGWNGSQSCIVSGSSADSCGSDNSSSSSGGGCGSGWFN